MLGAEATQVRNTRPAATRPRSAWAWPLSPQPSVVRRFIAPESRWGAGHRGVDLAGQAGQPVHAVAAGSVSHVGVVAGRGTVSVLHPSGIRSTYEPVDPSVRVGQLVAQGTTLGVLAAASKADLVLLGAVLRDDPGRTRFVAFERLSLVAGQRARFAIQ